MFWTVSEVQMLDGGQTAAAIQTFDNEEDALARYFTIGAAAAKSGLPYHALWVVRSDGRMRECRIFDRRTGAVNDG